MEPLSAPMLELLEWVRFRPRTHTDAIEAWASHCPRFTLWEDALELELIELEPGGKGSCRVQLTSSGRSALEGASSAIPSTLRDGQPLAARAARSTWSR